MIDYQALLKKYMDLVDYHEGTTFVSDAMYAREFTPEELAELNRIEGEVLQSCVRNRNDRT